LPLKDLKTLVTGGAGFIGSHLVDKLIDDGAEVTVLDNLSTGKTENIEKHLQNRNMQFVKGNICNFGLVKKLVRDVDSIINLAAIVSVPDSIKNPLLVNKVNVIGTLNLLKASLNGDIKRFIQASSAAVYGESETLPISEDLIPKPVSPYAVSKIAAENYAQVFSHVYGLETVCLRFFNVFGLRQAYNPYSGAITIFINDLLNNRPPTIFGDGEQTRDFVSVYDVASCCMLALTKEGIGGQVFNVSSGKTTTVNSLVWLLQKMTNRVSLKPIYMNPRCGDIRHSWGNIDKARKVLGYIPKVSLEKGLKELLDYQ
jgi:nucleoside-diphosphate-sugar epimerase